MRKDNRTHNGFTLVEMSMVLIIIGLILMTVFPALISLRTYNQRNLTDSNLQALLRATAVYAQATGCLPCPAAPDAVGPDFGMVGTVATGSPPSRPTCGKCAQPEGISPFASLGIPESLAKDGWGRWITMRIDTELARDFKVIPPTLPSAGVSKQGMCLQNLSKTNQPTVSSPDETSQPAAVVFVSHGANGFGAYSTLSSSMHPPIPGNSSCSGGRYEACNADNDLNFINAPLSNDKDYPFDDILLFMDRNNLLSLFGNGSCSTKW
ncbi:MAG: type II secretion system protein [Alphaproteobacteria bacterium]|nr:type II secretion system protein [Alphaproteobacteria bacterium]